MKKFMAGTVAVACLVFVSCTKEEDPLPKEPTDGNGKITVQVTKPPGAGAADEDAHPLTIDPATEYFKIRVYNVGTGVFAGFGEIDYASCAGSCSTSFSLQAATYHVEVIGLRVVTPAYSKPGGGAWGRLTTLLQYDSALSIVVTAGNTTPANITMADSPGFVTESYDATTGSFSLSRTNYPAFLGDFQDIFGTVGVFRSTDGAEAVDMCSFIPANVGNGCSAAVAPCPGGSTCVLGATFPNQTWTFAGEAFAMGTSYVDTEGSSGGISIIIQQAAARRISRDFQGRLSPAALLAFAETGLKAR